MMNNEKTVYLVKYILYATSVIWISYLVVFFHELGHAIAVIALGGTVKEFIVSWGLSGKVVWILGNVPMEAWPQVKTLVGVSGGIGAALFFMVLTHKSKWFSIPALFSLVDGFGEAMYLADTRFTATYGIQISVIVICVCLFWQFGNREIDKRMIEKVEKRNRMVPEHIFEKAMRALEKCVDKLEEERKTEVMTYDAMESENV